MLRIEFEEPTESVCNCCQSTTVRLTRFVYKDDDAFAVYYAQYTHGHSEKRLSGIISLGEWGSDEVGPEARLAFPFQIWVNDDDFQVGLVDAVGSPWSHVTFLGRILDRKEALAHKWINDVFHITDHMVQDDKEIVSTSVNIGHFGSYEGDADLLARSALDVNTSYSAEFGQNLPVESLLQS